MALSQKRLQIIRSVYVFSQAEDSPVDPVIYGALGLFGTVLEPRYLLVISLAEHCLGRTAARDDHKDVSGPQNRKSPQRRNTS